MHHVVNKETKLWSIEVFATLSKVSDETKGSKVKGLNLKLLGRAFSVVGFSLAFDHHNTISSSTLL